MTTLDRAFIEKIDGLTFTDANDHNVICSIFEFQTHLLDEIGKEEHANLLMRNARRLDPEIETFCAKLSWVYPNGSKLTRLSEQFASFTSFSRVVLWFFFERHFKMLNPSLGECNFNTSPWFFAIHHAFGASVVLAFNPSAFG